jgi:hypothetical protein
VSSTLAQLMHDSDWSQDYAALVAPRCATSDAWHNWRGYRYRIASGYCSLVTIIYRVERPPGPLRPRRRFGVGRLPAHRAAGVKEGET